jgi:predicted nucleotidyltransferase component of viral defense system
MLYYETIEPELLELLTKLLKIEEFKELRLVGGTSLALQYGHRKSVDIDLFGSLNLSLDEISDLISSCGKSTQLKRSAKINIFSIDGIKVDIVNYHYPWLNSVLLEDNLRLAQPEDIAAMKISAITGRGTKKDFIDLFELLKHFSLEEILIFYESKYADGSVYLALKSLNYFGDAEENPMPDMLNPVSWADVKRKIEQEVNAYLR